VKRAVPLRAHRTRAHLAVSHVLRLPACRPPPADLFKQAGQSPSGEDVSSRVGAPEFGSSVRARRMSIRSASVIGLEAGRANAPRAFRSEYVMRLIPRTWQYRHGVGPGRHVVATRASSRFPTLYVCALPLTFPIHAFVMMSTTVTSLHLNSVAFVNKVQLCHKKRQNNQQRVK